LRYQNAAELFPAHLLEEIHKYVDDGLVYIPRNADKTGWGRRSGAREALCKRNRQIYNDYTTGLNVYDLADKYYLSPETIKKIIYGKNQSWRTDN
jgi:DNA-binding NarL/FixJ family response regulator